MNTNLKKALFLTTLGYLQANEGFLAIMPDENKQEDISQEQKLEHKMEQKLLHKIPLKSNNQLLYKVLSCYKVKLKEKLKSKKSLKNISKLCKLKTAFSWAQKLLLQEQN